MHTQVAVDGRVMMPYTHPCPPIILRVHKHTYSSQASYSIFTGASNTHTSRCLLEICLRTDTYTHLHSRLIACTNSFLLHAYSSVSLARMRRYTQLSYLLHQCAKSLLSRTDCIADCTVRYMGLERQLSS